MAARLFAVLGVAEFATTDWQGRIKNVIGDPLPFDHNTTKAEIPDLLATVGLRAARGQEILDQDSRLNVYFAHALMLSPSSHPHTLRLLEMAYQIGLVIVMHFKKVYNRARPQQVCPTIYPMLPGPMQPSYPSGHSLQSHLIAAVLARVVPDDVAPILETLAKRIAKNREIAGVHFQSDSKAGENAAAEAIKILTAPENETEARSLPCDVAQGARGACAGGEIGPCLARECGLQRMGNDNGRPVNPQADTRSAQPRRCRQRHRSCSRLRRGGRAVPRARTTGSSSAASTWSRSVTPNGAGRPSPMPSTLLQSETDCTDSRSSRR